MSRGTAIIARSGRRIAVSLVGSAALLLGSWYLLSTGPVPELATSAVGPEPAPAGVRAADHDPASRPVDFDPRPDHIASQPPPIDPIPEHMLTPERRARLANPGPRLEADPDANAPLVAARAVATEHLQQLLDDRRDALWRACGNGESPTIALQATFGPDGELLAREFGDPGNVPGLRDCLQSQPFAAKGPATGFEVRVRALITAS